jgi:hypothetical protein
MRGGGLLYGERRSVPQSELRERRRRDQLIPIILLEIDRLGKAGKKLTINQDGAFYSGYEPDLLDVMSRARKHGRRLGLTESESRTLSEELMERLEATAKDLYDEGWDILDNVAAENTLLTVHSAFSGQKIAREMYYKEE